MSNDDPVLVYVHGGAFVARMDFTGLLFALAVLPRLACRQPRGALGAVRVLVVRYDSTAKGCAAMLPLRPGRRRLHAAAAKGTATILAPGALRFSPVHGLLCWGSPMLSALWEVGGDGDSPAVARLTRALFHRHDPLEPLRITQNRSHPAQNHRRTCVRRPRRRRRA